MPGTAMREAVPGTDSLPSTSPADVLVIGAGAAGLLLGIDLSRHRAHAVLLAADEDAFCASAAAAEPVGLDVAGQELLDDLGVLDRLIAVAAAAGAGRTAVVMSDLELLTVPAGALHTVLHDRLIELGGRVYRGYTYAGCEPDGERLDAYAAGSAGPITVRTRYLVRTDVPDSAVDGARRFSVGTSGPEVNRSMQDAYNLGWKLAAALGGRPDWIAQTYQIERIAERACALTLPSARPRPASGGALPGDRAPDAPVLTASGAATRLATLLHGPHWTLLCYGLEPAALAAVGLVARAGLHVHAVGSFGDLVDIEGELQWAYGLADGDWVLIRPDGVLAAIGGGAELDRLRGYLATVGLSCASSACSDGDQSALRGASSTKRLTA